MIADGTAATVAVSRTMDSCQLGCFLLAWDLNEEKVEPNLNECEHPLIPHTKWNMGSMECASNECFIRLSRASQR